MCFAFLLFLSCLPWVMRFQGPGHTFAKCFPSTGSSKSCIFLQDKALCRYKPLDFSHFWGCDLPNLSASHGGPSGLCWWTLLWTSLYPKMACASWQTQSSMKGVAEFLSEFPMESSWLFPIECHCVDICALHACQQNCTGFSVVCKPHVWYVWRTLVCDAWIAMRKWGLYVIIR